MRILSWLLRAFVFFTLFAFALNNQEPVVVHGFFGLDWHAPLVIVVLLAFGAGSALGVLAMLPPWWRARRRAADGTRDLMPDRPATAPAAGGRDMPPASGPKRAEPPPSGFDGGSTTSRADLGI
ncbi:MAG: LapA family protein [Rhodoferax sp.]|nr:LapA family protein [Rhodoferax sp.]MCP5288444.1 LapA family protein [Burkholderiaceae bacterium]